VRRLALPLAALLTLPLVACSGGGVLAPRTSDRTAADLSEIKQRLVDIQREVTMSRVEVEELRRRVERLESAAGIRRPTASTTRPSTPAPQTRTTPPPAQRRDVTESRPPRPLEETPVEGSDVEVGEPVPVAPPSDDSPRMDSTPGSAPGSAPDTGSQPISPAGQALYDRGYTLYHQDRYLDAEAAFQRFLQSHSSTDLADNAQYWIGEARYARRDFSGALAAFREVVSRHPNGNKVPDALLKAGQCLEEVGDDESARTSYREVIDRFPGSAASAVAEDRLARLP